MPKPLQQGLYIAFEGIDGTGKTTQMNLLKEWLEHIGYPVFLTREPGGTDCKIAEQIRQVILDASNGQMLPATEALLFAASRAQSVNEVIVPHLQNKEIVLSDRSIGSTMAYQGAGRHLTQAFLRFINRPILEHQPNYTFYLQIPYKEALARRAQRQGIDVDRIEAADQTFYEEVIQGFDRYSSTHRGWCTIDATKSVDETQTLLRILTRKILSLPVWTQEEEPEWCKPVKKKCFDPLAYSVLPHTNTQRIENDGSATQWADIKREEKEKENGIYQS